MNREKWGGGGGGVAVSIIFQSTLTCKNFLFSVHLEEFNCFIFCLSNEYDFLADTYEDIFFLCFHKVLSSILCLFTSVGRDTHMCPSLFSRGFQQADPEP